MVSHEANDLLIGTDGDTHWFTGPRVHSRNTHGTGCTLSAAITACLAQKMDLHTSCRIAKNYLHQAIHAAKDESVGLGNGPVNHFYHFWPVQLEDI